MRNAVQHFWPPDESVTSRDGVSTATLHWQTADGHWLSLSAVDVDSRADWQAQTLKTAGKVVHADRSVPAPIRIGPLPADFQNLVGAVNFDQGSVNFSMTRADDAAAVTILAFPAGEPPWVHDGVPVVSGPTPHTCSDANGLTLCVIVSGPEPASLTAIGGRQGLLDRITSLGTDPANWTTDVLAPAAPATVTAP